MKIKRLQLDREIRLPGGHAGTSSSTSSHFTIENGYDIDYSPQTQLISINKGGETRHIHISRTVDFDVVPEEKAKK